MATCVECDAGIDVDEFDVDRGDQLSCPECGTNLVVVSLSPVDVDLVSDDEDNEPTMPRSMVSTQRKTTSEMGRHLTKRLTGFEQTL